MKKTLCIIPHTHWDREWHMTFGEFRKKLVKLMDNLLDLLEASPDFKYFTLDGQSVILEDYLEVKPKNYSRLKNLVKEGRLVIGPWYVLPDEFLVAGESLARNLLFGHKVAARFGKIMKIGYLPDQFGHSPAMPKILRAADIACAFIWRGVGDRADKNEFIWEGDDGSKVLTVYMRNSYSNGVGLPGDKMELIKRLKTEAEALEPYSLTPYILIMNGSDHKEPQYGLCRALETLKKQINYDIEISNPADYRQKILKKIRPENLQVLKGELRDCKKAHLLPGVLSSRVYLKQKSDEIETLLTCYAEPLSVFAAVNGLPAPEKELPLAWKNLLLNHPHDSICGCSIDEVHEDMARRFDESELQAKNAVNFSVSRILGGMRGKGDKFVVFNTSPYPRSDSAEAEMPDRSSVQFMADNVPACGYRDYYLYEIREFKAGGLKSDKNSIENKYYRVTANKNGTVNIFDKEKKAVYKNCLKFEETGDAGDEYNFSPPKNNFNVITPVEVKISVRGPDNCCAQMEILAKYQYPESLSEDGLSRSENTAENTVRTVITLYSGARRVEFTTYINNQSRDHRVRVLFPLCFDFKKTYSLNHFGIIERDIKPPVYSEDHIETPVNTKPHLGFVYAEEGNYKACLASKGMREYEVIHGNVLALTLLRCVGWLSKEHLAARKGAAGPEIPTPGAQMPGERKFSYSFSTGTGFEAVKNAYDFRRPLKAYYVPEKEESGDMPGKKSYLQIEPASIILSAFKMPEEEGTGVIARVYNASDTPETACITPVWKVKSVKRVNLLEQDKTGGEEGLVMQNNTITLDILPNEFVTLKIEI